MSYSLLFLMVRTIFTIFQAETCSLSIPDLEFEMGGYALGGRFTTLEGLLNNVLEQVDTNPPLGSHNSSWGLRAKRPERQSRKVQVRP